MTLVSRLEWLHMLLHALIKTSVSVSVTAEEEGFSLEICIRWVLSTPTIASCFCAGRMAIGELRRAEATQPASGSFMWWRCPDTWYGHDKRANFYMEKLASLARRRICELYSTLHTDRKSIWYSPLFPLSPSIPSLHSLYYYIHST